MRKRERCNHTTQHDRCAYTTACNTVRLGGFGKRDEENRMRQVIFPYLPEEMQTVEEERERKGMKECTGRRECSWDRFVSISVEEMGSFYRYTRCCQRLHCKFCGGVSLNVLTEMQEPLP